MLLQSNRVQKNARHRAHESHNSVTAMFKTDKRARSARESHYKVLTKPCWVLPAHATFRGSSLDPNPPHLGRSKKEKCATLCIFGTSLNCCQGSQKEREQEHARRIHPTSGACGPSLPSRLMVTKDKGHLSQLPNTSNTYAVRSTGHTTSWPKHHVLNCYMHRICNEKQYHAHLSIFVFVWILCLMVSLHRPSADTQIGLGTICKPLKAS